jgi:C4-dicarboxylate-specific signal transduction histidine kinase
VTAFQALMLVLAMTGLIAGALVTGNRRTEYQLRLHQDSLARLARLGSMGELAAAVAHEINQPLMAAGTYARLVVDTLQAGPGKDATVVETASKAANQVERAAEVVKRLRALIRLDQSGRAPVRIERIVQETLALCQPNLDRHNVIVSVALDEKLPPVLVDLLQIEQVLINLLRNAIEAFSEADRRDGAITIEASPSGHDAVEVRLRDNGPGFANETALDQVPPLLSAKPEGLGIGLSLCRSIVEAHGGRMWLSGAAPGAIVHFTLPRAPADA